MWRSEGPRKPTIPQTITLVGCFTVSVTGTSELLSVQTRSFWRFGGWYNSNEVSSEKKSLSSVLDWPGEASSREIQPFLKLGCCQPGLFAQFQRLQMQAELQMAVHGRLGDGMLLRSQFLRQFPRWLVPFQQTSPQRFLPFDSWPSSSSVPAILQRLSSVVESHSAFEGSWLNIQLLSDLDLGQAAVHHANSAIARRWGMLLHNGWCRVCSPCEPLWKWLLPPRFTPGQVIGQGHVTGQ